MVEIIPAILPKSYEELTEKLDIVASHSPYVQIDICDGGYVPNRTWPYMKGTAPESDQTFADIVSQEQAIPHWEEINFEFDLMCRDVYEKIPDFISAGAGRIIVHHASLTPDELANIIRDYGKHSEELGPFDVELGIALMPGDSPDSIKDIADNIHFVQVMGIEKIGFQGQTASPKVAGLVHALKMAYPNLPCVVDGGVTIEVAKELVEAGVDRLVVGSALFENTDFLGTLEEFKGLSYASYRS